ncbi:carnosine N-methyltransferase-like isoform X2 [Mizuhopecten yessoensis]|uniref:carnosine N-methyltransferase-like isoform X2 n=1 Tax=Mizuhopecten yessoensis TaxID=6573 RepID=UPI000B459430|nr:carnosine N-methyltransferase-like isoform X2 [Mizuhopecten yessoensis]
MADNSSQNIDDQLEKEHFLRVCNAFKFYRTHSHRRINDSEISYRALSKKHKELVPDFLENLENIRTCVDHNYEIIKLILHDAEYMFENQTQDTIENSEEDVKQTFPTSADMDKVRTTLKQFVRDWSSQGQQERDACYRPVIEEIVGRFPPQLCKRSDVKVLIPGAGLGRLALELAKLGFTCQGNEWSLFMLLASNFILNKCREENSLILYPWVHQWCNNKRTEDQTRAAHLPDINPGDLPEDSNFSMAAGDFLEVYRESEWDCVATVFFLDTARNVIAYVEAIWKILQPGGYWVNLGPLLYHYAEMADENSIELSYEQVKKVIIEVGFQFEKEEMDIKSSYTQSVDSMFQYQYNSVFFVVRKPL